MKSDMRIKVVMKSPVPKVEPGTTLGEAETLLAQAGTPALPVMEAGRLVGLVHRRDLLRVRPSTVPALARYEWAAPDRLRVADVMRREIVTVAPEAEVAEVARLFKGREAEAVLVVDGGEVVGLVGVRELLTVLVRELERRWPPRLGRILAAVGADERATPVLPAALALARHHQARLILLHVMAPLRPRLAAEVGRDILDRVAAQRRAHARQWLASLVPAELDVTVAVAENDEAAEVVAAAARNAVDLIVAEAGIAQAIAHQAPCPVLAVPAGRTQHASR
jgi:CBS domain-containing protein/nucleotide-binding universal stress UspA family protein